MSHKQKKPKNRFNTYLDLYNGTPKFIHGMKKSASKGKHPKVAKESSFKVFAFLFDMFIFYYVDTKKTLKHQR